ncbi:MAG: hypothetical protein OXU73_01565 [Candidatus Campbellbacteria bacterium]|nr:hypothetical protein [Candidatus Campbellbacteria bacterium]
MNNEEIEKLLKQNIKLSRENYRLLRALRRSTAIGSIIRFLFIIIVIAFGYYGTINFVVPAIDVFRAFEQKVESVEEKIEDETERYKAVVEVIDNLVVPPENKEN